MNGVNARTTLCLPAHTFIAGALFWWGPIGIHAIVPNASRHIRYEKHTHKHTHDNDDDNRSLNLTIIVFPMLVIMLWLSHVCWIEQRLVCWSEARKSRLNPQTHQVIAEFVAASPFATYTKSDA